MAQLKDATTQEVVSWNGDQIHWNITFLRSLNEWQEEDMDSLLGFLANTNIVFQGEDDIHWSHNSSGQFTVKSYCEESFRGSPQLDFLAKAI